MRPNPFVYRGREVQADTRKNFKCMTQVQLDRITQLRIARKEAAKAEKDAERDLAKAQKEIDAERLKAQKLMDKRTETSYSVTVERQGSDLAMSVLLFLSNSFCLCAFGEALRTSVATLSATVMPKE